MESWMPLFVAVTALAVVLQACMMAAIFFEVRNLSKRIEETTNEIRSRVAPILGRVQMIVDDVHPQISNMVADAAHITQLARTQVQHADHDLRPVRPRGEQGGVRHARECYAKRRSERKSIGRSLAPRVARSASASPITLANLNPCPLKPQARMTRSGNCGWRSRMKCESGLFV